MVAHCVHLESKDTLQMHPTALQCIWVHLERVYTLQMYLMHYHSAYRSTRYGSALGTFGERLCSPNVPNALPKRIRTIFMVRMHIGSALGIFGEQRRSPNAPNRSPMHLGACGERLCSPNIPNALP